MVAFLLDWIHFLRKMDWGLWHLSQFITYQCSETCFWNVPSACNHKKEDGVCLRYMFYGIATYCFKSKAVELWSLNCYLFFSIDEQWVVSEISTWMVQKTERGIMGWRTWSTSGESPADVGLNGRNVGNHILHMHI